MDLKQMLGMIMSPPSRTFPSPETSSQAMAGLNRVSDSFYLGWVLQLLSFSTWAAANPIAATASSTPCHCMVYFPSYIQALGAAAGAAAKKRQRTCLSGELVQWKGHRGAKDSIGEK